MIDRFDYAANIVKATSYQEWHGTFWPPAAGYEIACLNLAEAIPIDDPEFLRSLGALRTSIDFEWLRAKEHGMPPGRCFADSLPIAQAMRRIEKHLAAEADRLALTHRVSAIQNGYDADILQALSTIEEDIAVIAGRIATWYGKQFRGLPTAFACRRDKTRQRHVSDALRGKADIPRYLTQLHADLRLGDLPTFAAMQVFFMAGEGNLHPKHIAYFMPEDEGVKHSPFKKTYYFANTHRALLEHFSAPLTARLLDIGVQFDPADPRFEAIPTMGVLAHELGHSVHRPVTSFNELNALNRWASVVLQEVTADVFGTLILAEVWAEQLKISPADVIAYYLAECLRYLDRGLGHFPDSDGMFLQLSYFVRCGALTIEERQGPRLVGDTDVILAALRSLARVLADALLAGKPEPAVSLHRAFGPATIAPLRPVIEDLRRFPSGSVEYVQEHA